VPGSAPAPAIADDHVRDPGEREAEQTVDVDASVQRQLAAFNEETQSAASRPGMLRVNYFRYARLFPMWPLVFSFWTALMFLLAWLLHWLWFVLAIPSLICLWIHYRRTNAHFIGGCINPGMIASLDPPLIAVSTNLGRAEGGDCPVIKILDHPIGEMGNIEEQVGSCFPTVAVYCPLSDGPHWNDFDPIAANCATSNLAQLNRMMATMDESDWMELEFGLSQIPKPYEPGLYRTFLATQHRPTVDVAQMVLNTIPHAPDDEQYLAAHGIPADVLQRVAGGYAAGVDPSHVLAVIGGTQVGQFAIKHTRGMVIIPQGLVYDFQDEVAGRVAWGEIRGAMYGWCQLEIVKTSYERISIADSSFLQNKLCWNIEHLINTICDVARG